jgi:hypothetical protein
MFYYPQRRCRALPQAAALPLRALFLVSTSGSKDVPFAGISICKENFILVRSFI